MRLRSFVMILLLTVLCATAGLAAPQVRYHEQIGIPEAARIKKAEENVQTTTEASEPTTPEANAPTTPAASEPTTPEASKPTTPEANVPTTPEANVPTTPEANTPTTPEANTPIVTEPSAPTSTPGSISPPGAFPYVGGLVITMTTGPPSVCSSALVSSTRALTAAHCWWDGYSRAKQFTVVLGSNRLFMGGTRVTTDNVVVHADWNPLNDATNDIAIISFPPVKFTRLIQPVTLPSGSQPLNNFAGETATAAGFAKTQGSTSNSPTIRFLHHVDMQIITNTVCHQSYPIVDSMMCATGDTSLSCGGESGGPLVVKSGSDHVLVGVASIGPTCKEGEPSVFTRITAFTTWIEARLV